MIVFATVGDMYTADANANVAKAENTTVLNFDSLLDLRLITS
jgi:hypothetical protein